MPHQAVLSWCSYGLGVNCDQLCRELKIAVHEKLLPVLVLLDCQPVPWDSEGKPWGLDCQAKRGGMGQVEFILPAWPEEGRDKKEERISRERMWLLVGLIAESCELGWGRKLLDCLGKTV